MTTYRNQDVHTRVWPGLKRPDGRTLELGPGEECELDLPEDFSDAHLQNVSHNVPERAQRTTAPPKAVMSPTPRSTPPREAGSPPDATAPKES